MYKEHTLQKEGSCNGDGTLGNITSFLLSPRLYPAHGIGTQLASMAVGTSNRLYPAEFVNGDARGPKLGTQNKPQKQPHFEPRRGAKGEMRQH